MNREVCLFDKFSFCKNGVRCLKIHLKEVCQNRECDYKKCNKRHPRPCRFYRMNGFCKFGTSCRYSHRLPREVEEQNDKIESIEKENAELKKQVDDQNAKIKELEGKLLEIESRELKNLQNQVNDLVKNNNEKEKALKKLREEFEWFVDTCAVEEQDDDQDDVELEEKETDLEKEAIKHPSYVGQALNFVDSAYRDVTKLRKNSRSAKNILQELSKTLSVVPSMFDQTPNYVAPSKVYQKEVSRLQSLSESTEAKLDKEACILEIMRCKKQLQTITL